MLDERWAQSKRLLISLHRRVQRVSLRSADGGGGGGGGDEGDRRPEGDVLLRWTG